MTAFNDVEIVNEESRLTVKAPYNPLFARRARALGGRFDDDAKTWVFNPRVERLVREALDKCFWWHEGVEDELRVTISIDPYDFLYVYSNQDDKSVWFAGRELAVRFQFDRPPRMMSNVAIADGTWPKGELYSGLNIKPGKLKMLVWDVPVSFLERLESDKFELVEPDGDTLEAVENRINAVEGRLTRLKDLRTRIATAGKDGE